MTTSASRWSAKITDAKGFRSTHTATRIATALLAYTASPQPCGLTNPRARTSFKRMKFALMTISALTLKYVGSKQQRTVPPPLSDA